MDIENQLAEYWVFDREKFYSTLEEYSKKTHKELPACICLIHKNLHKAEKKIEILKILNSMDVKSESPILAFFFYLYWFLFDVAHSREEEAIIILKKMEACIGEGFPVCLRGEYLLCKATVEKGDSSKKIYNDGLLLLPKESDRYKLAINNLFQQYSVEGRLTDIDAIYSQSLTKEFNHLFSFFNATENGQTEEALKLKEKVLAEQIVLPIPVKAYLENSIGLLDLYLGRIRENETNECLLPVKALLENDLSLALSSANSFYNNSNLTYQKNTSFNFFTLIRAQLANKNLDAAKLIIESWKKDVLWYTFSDFFIARTELLNNNPEKAARHFSEILKYCKKNNAMGRLDFELELALELQPKQIRFLMDRASLNSEKVLDINATQLSVEPVEIEVGINRIKGNSLVIKAIKEDIKKFADLDIPVLILGETGVGKDVVASAIHEESKRKAEPFIAINCSSIAEGLLQSELFGHEAGSYTGASKAHKGIFQEAGLGTVFLDEIGDISSGLQAALLRVLESGEYRPVGSAKPKIFRCRVIAATNALLETKVDVGLFRLDLLYRLKRLVVQILPLRERPIDISLLAHHFLNLNKSSANFIKMNQDLEAALLTYAWPGNVRELKNEMEKMRLLHSGKPFYTLEDAQFLKNNLMKDSRVQSSTPLQNTKPEKNIPKPISSKEEIFQNSGSYFRRIEAIKKLFDEHKNLSRKEICQITGVPDLTIGRHLKTLREENYIVKMEPTKSPRTHYFALKIN